MTLEKVLLAPVPDEQLTKAQAVCQREGTVAFPSNVWSLSSDVHGGMSILFYASNRALSSDVSKPDDQSRLPSATWLGSFVRYVSTVQGDQREVRSVQAATTAEHGPEQIVGFYEVASLEQLSEQRWVAIERLRDQAGEPYPRAFIPNRPIIAFWERKADGTSTAPPGSGAERPEGAESSWFTFTQQLASAVSRMQRDQCLILSIAHVSGETEHPSYYVQFACGGEEGFRAEAVSNRHLADRWKLSEKAAETLFRLGWHAPEPASASDRGKVNYWGDWPAPPNAAAIAQLTASTFRRVYGVTAPDQLEYNYFEKGGTLLELSELGLRRRADEAKDETVEHLRPLVEQALRGALKVDAIKYDENGDIPVRFGSALVFVRLAGGETPKIQVFSRLLWKLSSTSGLTEALNEINASLWYGRVFWDGQGVMATIELPVPGLSSEYVALACLEIGSLADHFDEELVERFGGKTMFGISKIEKPYTPPGYL